MKKKKSPMKRKTKAIIGVILCLALLAANIALNGYTWTKEAALREIMEYRATGEMELVSAIPDLSIKNKADYKFYLMENENCFAMFSINHHFFHGWLDGPCLTAEKDQEKALQLCYNSYTSRQDKNKEMLRIFGLVGDENIACLEIDVYFATAGSDQTLEKLTLKTDKFIDHGEERYFNIDHIYADELSKYLMPPFTARAYNGAGDPLYTEEFSFGQSTSIG